MRSSACHNAGQPRTVKISRVIRLCLTLSLGLTVAAASLLNRAITLGAPPGQSGAETISYGQSVLGQITRSSHVAFYFLRAQRGDVITVTMRRVSGSLDPHLDLATAEGGILASNDDDPLSEGTLNAAIRDFTIQKSGIYLIQAMGYGQSEGSFTLAVTQIPPEELGLTIERAQLIDYGATIQSAWGEESPTRYFRFHAEAGDLLTVTVRSSDASPAIAILDQAGSELARAENDGTGQARITAFSVPASGAYVLVASATQIRTSEGTAQFDLQFSGRAAPRAGQPVEIRYGDTLNGVISDASPVEEYIFQGRAGDVVRISMERASGDLDALVTIYDQSRKQIAFDDDGAGEKDALIDAFMLPYDGPYIIAASRYQRGQGLTGGAYFLHLEQIGPGQ